MSSAHQTLALAPRVECSLGTLGSLLTVLRCNSVHLPADLLDTISEVCDKASLIDEALQPYLRNIAQRHFPDEVVGLIMSYLDFDRVHMASSVSRLWACVVQDDSTWAALYRERCFLVDQVPPSAETWRQRYTYRHRCEDGWTRPATVRVLGRHSGTVTSLHIAGSSMLVTASDDGSIKVFDVATGRPLTPGINGHAGAVFAVRLLRPDRILSGSYDKTIKVWDLHTSQCMATLRGHTGWISCLEADERFPEQFVSGSWDSSMRIWRVLGDAEDAECTAVLEGGGGSVYCMHRPERCSLASGCQGGELHWWDLERHQVAACWKGHAKAVYAIQESRGTIASGDAAGVVKLWDQRRLGPTSSVVAHAQNKAVMAMSLSHHKLVTGSYDGTIALWDTRSLRERVATYSHHKAPVFCLQAQDEHLISGSEDRTVCMANFCAVDSASHDDWGGVVRDRRFELLQSLSSLSQGIS